MNQDLIKWLVHQPIQIVAVFVLGAIMNQLHPDLCNASNLAILLATVAGVGGGYLSYQQQVAGSDPPDASHPTDPSNPTTPKNEGNN